MKAFTNLTSPRFMHTIDLRGIDHGFIRSGILRLSPGQWVTTDGTTKSRFVRVSACGDLWLTHGTNPAQFRLACQKWLAIDAKIAA